MKNRIGIVVLVVVCVGLGIALISIKNEASRQKKEDTATIGTYSNKASIAQSKLEEQKQVTAMIQTDLEAQKKSAEKALTELTNSVEKMTVDLARAESARKISEQEVQQRDAKIADLESQNQLLDRKALNLTTALTNLTIQIADTQQRLASTEGDKAFLEGQLKHLLAEKTELERQFNDLTVLRAQVAKLKEEMNVARRVEWTRQGLYASTEQKGAQKLIQGLGGAIPRSPARPAYDLNVEVRSDGSVKLIPPGTNSAAGGVSPLPK